MIVEIDNCHQAKKKYTESVSPFWFIISLLIFQHIFFPFSMLSYFREISNNRIVFVSILNHNNSFNQFSNKIKAKWRSSFWFSMFSRQWHINLSPRNLEKFRKLDDFDFAKNICWENKNPLTHIWVKSANSIQFTLH